MSELEVWIDELQTATPVGTLCLAVTRRGLWRVKMTDDPRGFFDDLAARCGFPLRAPASTPDPLPARRLEQAFAQLSEFLGGHRQVFDLELDFTGVPAFQHSALLAAQKIGFGQMCTYQDLARQLGRPGAARAVGAAMSANPLPLIIPCHRVVGSDRKLHGFAAPGGVRTKAWLLALEGIPVMQGKKEIHV
jgi:methylated-DNA-[protein]-cysteine S-methyltransferase